MFGGKDDTARGAASRDIGAIRGCHPGCGSGSRLCRREQAAVLEQLANDRPNCRIAHIAARRTLPMARQSRSVPMKRRKASAGYKQWTRRARTEPRQSHLRMQGHIEEEDRAESALRSKEREAGCVRFCAFFKTLRTL